MRWTIALLAILAAAAVSAATLYRWVDRNGVVHYADRPEPGATQVELRAAQTFSAPSTPVTRSAQASGTQAQQQQYEKLDLWKPENDATFTNTANQVEVRLRLEPDLLPGHAIWLYLDGKRVDGLAQAGEAFTLENVWRGTHALYAIVADRDGRPVIRSQTVNFHMQQASLLAPRRQRPAG